MERGIQTHHIPVKADGKMSLRRNHIEHPDESVSQVAGQKSIIHSELEGACQGGRAK
jgi:hypothetical protein